MPIKNQSAIVRAKGHLRPFHYGVMLIIAVLLVFSFGAELWRRQNPAELLFNQDAPEDANLLFKVQNLAGRSQDFFSFTGQGHVIIYGWETQCTACASELKDLIILQEKIPLQKLRVVLVALDSDVHAVESYLKAQNLKPHAVYRADPAKTLREALMIEQLPARYLVNRDGKIVGTLNKAIPWADPRVIKALGALENN